MMEDVPNIMSVPLAVASVGGSLYAGAKLEDGLCNAHGQMAVHLEEFSGQPTAGLFAWARVLGCGAAPLWWRRLVQLVLVTSLLVLPCVASLNSQSFMYTERNTVFGQLFAGISCVCAMSILVAHGGMTSAMHSTLVYDEKLLMEAGGAQTGAIKKTGVNHCTLMKGHMLRLVAEIDINDDGADNLRRWLSIGPRVLMGMAIVFSLQGFVWIASGWCVSAE